MVYKTVFQQILSRYNKKITDILDITTDENKDYNN